MPDDFLTAHGLRIVGPYAADRETTLSEDKPMECQIPPIIPGGLSLSPVVLPPYQCVNPIVDNSIPLPFTCPPAFTTSLAITTCSTDPALNLATVAVATPIAIVPIDDCQYELQGEIQICVPPPCIPTVTTDLFIGPCLTPGNSISITGGETIQIVPDDACGYKLTGNVEICAPCIPSFNGDIKFRTCPTPNNILQINGGRNASVPINYDVESCQYFVNGDIELCAPLPCIPQIYTDLSIVACSNPRNPITVVSTDDDEGGNPIKIVPIPDTCDYKLTGNLEICAPCIPSIYGGISVRACSTPHNPTTVNTLTPIRIVPKSYDIDGVHPCEYQLEGSVEICTPPIPCAPVFSGGVTITSCDSTRILVQGGNSIRIVPGRADANGNICDYQLVGAVSICAPKNEELCYLRNIDISGSARNELSGQAAPEFNIKGRSDCNSASFDISLSLAACDAVDVDVQVEAFDIEISLAGNKISQQISFQPSSPNGHANECDKSYRITPSSSKTFFDLGGEWREIEVCEGEGTNTYSFLIKQTGS